LDELALKRGYVGENVNTEKLLQILTEPIDWESVVEDDKKSFE
jgi:hypothetical protein